MFENDLSRRCWDDFHRLSLCLLQSGQFWSCLIACSDLLHAIDIDRSKSWSIGWSAGSVNHGANERSSTLILFQGIGQTQWSDGYCYHRLYRQEIHTSPVDWQPLAGTNPNHINVGHMSRGVPLMKKLSALDVTTTRRKDSIAFFYQPQSIYSHAFLLQKYIYYEFCYCTKLPSHLFPIIYCHLNEISSWWPINDLRNCSVRSGKQSSRNELLQNISRIWLSGMRCAVL